MREKETYAIVMTLLKFRSWVASTKVSIVVMTDHESLEHWWKEDLGVISGPVGRRGRWHEFLSGFNLEVIYVQGVGNVVADALSRWAYGAVDDPGDLTFHGSMGDMVQVEKWEQEDRKLDFAAAADLLAASMNFVNPVTSRICCVRTSASPSRIVMDIDMEEVWKYEGDAHYGEIHEKIKNGGIVKEFWIHQGRLRHDHLTCVPQKMVQKLLKMIHQVQHAGPEKTRSVFDRQYECKLSKADVQDIIIQICKQCELYQGLKSNKMPNKTLEFYPIPPNVFHSLAMDFVVLPAVKYEGV